MSESQKARNKRKNTELALWRGRAVEAALMACEICKRHEIPEDDDCRNCRMMQIQQQAGKE